jgi:hypothetical protein
MANPRAKATKDAIDSDSGYEGDQQRIFRRAASF